MQRDFIIHWIVTSIIFAWGSTPPVLIERNYRQHLIERAVSYGKEQIKQNTPVAKIAY